MHDCRSLTGRTNAVHPSGARKTRRDGLDVSARTVGATSVFGLRDQLMPRNQVYDERYRVRCCDALRCDQNIYALRDHDYGRDLGKGSMWTLFICSRLFLGGRCQHVGDGSAHGYLVMWLAGWGSPRTNVGGLGGVCRYVVMRSRFCRSFRRRSNKVSELTTAPRFGWSGRLNHEPSDCSR